MALSRRDVLKLALIGGSTPAASDAWHRLSRRLRRLEPRT